MNSGRTPACAVATLGGGNNTSGLDCSSQGNNRQYAESMQPRILGNRCGHDKNHFKKPRSFAEAKRRPHCLEEAKRRIGIAITDNFRFADFAELFYHSAQNNGSGRKRRSESVEGIFSLALPMLLQTLNIYRMACGFYDSGQNFHYIDYGYLENQTDQSSIRIKREMAVLQNNGIIKVNPIKKLTNDGVWRTIRVEIEFTDKIFQMLDLMDEFLKDRETLSIKFHAKQERLDRNRQKKELYRKPNFTSNRKPKQEVNFKRVLKPIPQYQKGNGVEIRDQINRLVSQGLSVKDAMEQVKQQYPPKH